jgi:hypothetical protein
MADGIRSPDLPLAPLAEFLGHTDAGGGVMSSARSSLADVATLLAGQPVFASLSGDHVGFDNYTELYSPTNGLLKAKGTIGEIISDPLGSTTNRARASGVATLTIPGVGALTAIGQDVNVRSVGGTGYNGHVTLTGVATNTISYASAGIDEGSTADTGGSVDRAGVYIKDADAGAGPWTWKSDSGVLTALAQAFAAVAAAAAAQALADAADERGLQAFPRRSIAKEYLDGERTADGYVTDFITYDGRRDESLFLVKHRRGAHPTFVERDVTTDGKLVSTLDYNGGRVDYFPRRYVDDMPETERYGWFGVLSVGTVYVATGFPYELSILISWPGDGADISMAMIESDQLISWVDAV